MIEVIGLDGDDTLWHSESLFAAAHDTFAAMLAPYTAPGFDVVARHYETELANLEVFGYGVKGFTLSMIETAIEVTDGRISGHHSFLNLSLFPAFGLPAHLDG